MNKISLWFDCTAEAECRVCLNYHSWVPPVPVVWLFSWKALVSCTSLRMLARGDFLTWEGSVGFPSNCRNVGRVRSLSNELCSQDGHHHYNSSMTDGELGQNVYVNTLIGPACGVLDRGGRALLFVRDPTSFEEIMPTRAPGLLNVQVRLPGSVSGAAVRYAVFFNKRL
ncbi:hypothetical protein AAHC03_05565 [Spirometra sp. Aus1]